VPRSGPLAGGRRPGSGEGARTQKRSERRFEQLSSSGHGILRFSHCFRSGTRQTQENAATDFYSLFSVGAVAPRDVIKTGERLEGDDDAGAEAERIAAVAGAD